MNGSSVHIIIIHTATLHKKLRMVNVDFVVTLRRYRGIMVKNWYYRFSRIIKLNMH